MRKKKMMSGIWLIFEWRRYMYLIVLPIIFRSKDIARKKITRSDKRKNGRCFCLIISRHTHNFSGFPNNKALSLLYTTGFNVKDINAVSLHWFHCMVLKILIYQNLRFDFRRLILQQSRHTIIQIFRWRILC